MHSIATKNLTIFDETYYFTTFCGNNFVLPHDEKVKEIILKIITGIVLFGKLKMIIFKSLIIKNIKSYKINSRSNIRI